MTKEEALRMLAERKAHQPKHINNNELYAGSPMYFYCEVCGHLSDVLPESYVTRPARYCKECQALKGNNWI